MWELHHSTCTIAIVQGPTGVVAEASGQGPEAQGEKNRRLGEGENCWLESGWEWILPFFDHEIRRMNPFYPQILPWILFLVWSLYCLCSRSTYGEPYMFRFSMVCMPPRWGLTGWRNDVRITYGVLTLPMVIRKGMVKLQSFQTLNWGDK